VSTHPVTLSTLLGDHAAYMALKQGRVSSPLVQFNFADVKVPNTAFKPMIREGRFDCGELAIITYLQAREHGKPLVLLPAVIMASFHHGGIFYNSARGTLAPADLTGKRVAVRSYTTTTGAIVRGFLKSDYGVDLDRVRWITFEDPHVAEYRDPPHVARAPEGKDPAQMLLDGEVDAAIVPPSPSLDPRLKPLVPDAAAAAQAWARKTGAVPINHMFVMRPSVAPEVVREVYRLLAESKTLAPANDFLRFGIEANRRSLEIMIDYAIEQRLIVRRTRVDDLFDETARALRG
jgi:4,5-dihydroxyphthalate decarboxylase